MKHLADYVLSLVKLRLNTQEYALYAKNVAKRVPLATDYSFLARKYPVDTEGHVYVCTLTWKVICVRVYMILTCQTVT